MKKLEDNCNFPFFGFFLENFCTTGRKTDKKNEKNEKMNKNDKKNDKK